MVAAPYQKERKGRGSGGRAILRLSLPKKEARMIAVRLRQLADDCEQRAALTGSAEACALYRLAARNCRSASVAPNLDSDGRRTVLTAMTALIEAAHWFACSETESGSRVRPELDRAHVTARKGLDLLASPPDRLSVAPPDSALNARQLSQRFAVPERTARRMIERGMRKATPGFYRDGRHLLADPVAFEASAGRSGRIVAEGKG